MTYHINGACVEPFCTHCICWDQRGRPIANFFFLYGKRLLLNAFFFHKKSFKRVWGFFFKQHQAPLTGLIARWDMFASFHVSGSYSASVECRAYSLPISEQALPAKMSNNLRKSTKISDNLRRSKFSDCKCWVRKSPKLSENLQKSQKISKYQNFTFLHQKDSSAWKFSWWWNDEMIKW